MNEAVALTSKLKKRKSQGGEWKAGDFKYIFDVVNRASYTTLVFFFRFVSSLLLYIVKSDLFSCRQNCLDGSVAGSC